MSLANILKMAKGSEEEKVGISLKVPISIKIKLEELSKENSVSVNALINAMIANGFEDVPLEKELYLELNELEKKLYPSLLREEEGGEYVNGFSINPGVIDGSWDYIKNLTTRVKALRKVLG